MTLFSIKISSNNGYTLFEFITILTIISILMMGAAQVARIYIIKLDTASVENAIEDLTLKLEHHKLMNGTYNGFTHFSSHIVNVPDNDEPRYRVEIVDLDTGLAFDDSESTGLNYALRATSASKDNPTYLLNSYGTKCRSQTPSEVTYLTCGTTDFEPW